MQLSPLKVVKCSKSIQRRGEGSSRESAAARSALWKTLKHLKAPNGGGAERVRGQKKEKKQSRVRRATKTSHLYAFSVNFASAILSMKLPLNTIYDCRVATLPRNEQ